MLQKEFNSKKIKSESIINSLKSSDNSVSIPPGMTQTKNQQFKSLLHLSSSTIQDAKIETFLKENKEAHSFKNKTIRKRNYQRRKKRYIVHSICVLDKTDPSNPKHKIETLLIQDKKPRHVSATADVSDIIGKRDDEHLKRMLDQSKLKKSKMEMKSYFSN